MIFIDYSRRKIWGNCKHIPQEGRLVKYNQADTYRGVL